MERNVKVSLLLNATNYVRGQMEAERATNKTRDAAALAAAKLQAQRDVMETTGRSAIFMGTLVAAGIAVAVKRYADFDQAMSNVIATGEDARRNQDALREAALRAGASTVYSATEAANAIEELAKAGVSARDILAGGLDASLDLAAAGNLAVADAAGIAATAMTQFNLRGEDMSHVADLLAAGAGKAMGDVDQLSQALNQAGLVANQTGLSIEETTAGLSAFAAAGLLGSDAGTSFKAMLQRLTPQSREAEQLMSELGISAYDAQGNFVGLANFAGNLQGALKDLTPEQRNAALATIFGADAVRAASVLYAEGADGIQKWTDEVNDQGYAARTAATRLDNLKGDIEALGGAFDTVLINGGSAANDSLRMMVQVITELVTWYGELPQPVQATAMAVGGVTAAVLLSGGIALNTVPKWAAFKTALDQSGISMGRTALTAGAAGLALGGLMAIIGHIATTQANARAKAQAYADAISSGADAVQDLADANLQAEKTFAFLNFGSAYDNAEKLGISLDRVTEAVTKGGTALEELDEILATATGGGEAAQKMADELGIAYLDLSQSAGTLREQVDEERAAQERANTIREQSAKATDENTESTESAAAAYLEAADQASALNDELSQLIDQINEANGVGQDAVSANIAYRDAVAEVEAAVAAGTTGLDLNTEVGRANMGMLVDLASKAQDAAAKQLELDGNTENYIATLQAGREDFIRRAQDLGYGADEAARLADQIFRIPDRKEAEVIVKTAQARADVQSFIRSFDGATITIPVRGSAQWEGPGFAGGGGIYGRGPKGVDSVPILAAPGEHMLTASEVDLMGGQAAVYRFRAALRAGQSLPRYANGGEIQPRYATSSGPSFTVAAPNLTLHVHAAPGMDEDALVNKAVRKVEGLLK